MVEGGNQLSSTPEDVAAALQEASSSALETCSTGNFRTLDMPVSMVLSILKIAEYGQRESFQMQPLPLHSQKVTVWCGFTVEFIVDSFFSRRSSFGRRNLYSQWTRYESLLRNHPIPALQQRGHVDRKILCKMVPPHIAGTVKSC
ncbi:hypothetical protein AVEN_107475-1 [Araneus ventricosus]|uniref:Uncharacterized protein n=1 Tax=Araneus ventricosus TaxID=182803 RepID=A0A4Y2N4K0_ARAVE|nr:hypothetical protein AVEN_107475-1 [Araneus ventricosus]